MNFASYIHGTALASYLIGLMAGVAHAADAGATNPDASPAKPRLAPPSPEQLELKKDKKYQQALKHLTEGLPLQASKLFRECLDSKLSDAAKDIVRPFYAESLVRAGKTEEGLTEWAVLPDSPLKNYWTATALFNKGYYTDALKKLAAIPQTDELHTYALQLTALLARSLKDNQLLIETLTTLSQSPRQAVSGPASILLANTLIETRRYRHAAETLEKLKAALDKEKTSLPLKAYATLLSGKLSNAQGDTERAITVFHELANQKDCPSKIRDLACLALARAEIAHEKNTLDQTKKDEADDAGTGVERIIAFIGGRAESSVLMDAFNILLKEDTFQTNPQAQEKLNGWVSTKYGHRQPVAMYAKGSILLDIGETTEGYELTQSALEKYPQNEAVRALALNTITALLEKNMAKEAESLIAAYPGVSTGIIFQQGVLAFRKGDYELARDYFRAVESYASQRGAEVALFNENLTLLHAGDSKTAAALPEKAENNPELKERLLFEQAHYAAKRMEPQAAELLDRFIACAATQALREQARLDRAEVALTLNPPDLKTAERISAELSAAPLTDEQSLQAARLNIMLAENRNEWTTAIQACRKAITLDAENKYADVLHLKLGELLFKNGDFHEVLLVLQPFPEKYPNSSLCAAALFLAGKAAQQSNTANALDTALNIFRTLGADKSEFSQSAKIEEASILLRMGKADECIAVLDNMLAAQLPRYMRLLALSIQADAWVTKENTNSESLRKAVLLCTEILDTPNLGLTWKFKALHQRALLHELMNEFKRALDDYASILAHTPVDNSNSARKDWHWFYNAGFASIRIMSQLQNWNGALAMATKLAQTSGPRAREAAAIARRIQLEHFIWQEEPTDVHEKNTQHSR